MRLERHLGWEFQGQEKDFSVDHWAKVEIPTSIAPRGREEGPHRERCTDSKGCDAR
jgi:hypothetical protein